MDKVLFYEGPWYFFSNFSSFMVRWRGIDWQTAEHAYQAAKFTDSVIVEKIRCARSAHDAKKIARAHSDQVVPNWYEINLDVMEEIVRAKRDQHPYVLQKLLETDGMEIIEDSPKDAFWGRGPDGNGLNNLGKTWMKLRKESRNAIGAA